MSLMTAARHTNFARAMTEALANAGFTKYRLGKETGLSQGNLSRWQSGHMLPSDGAIQTIADALGVSFDSLRVAADLDRLGTDGLARLAAISSVNQAGDISPAGGESQGNTDVWPPNVPGPHVYNGVEFAGLGRMISLPLYGFVACGEPQWIPEQAEMWVQWPESIVKDADAMLVVRGDSMVGCGYQPGDQLVVKMLDGETPRAGQKVVAQLPDGRCTCKVYQDGPGGPYLEAAPVEGNPWRIEVGPGVRLLAVVKRRIVME